MFPIRLYVAFLSILSLSLQFAQAGPVQRQEHDLQPRDDVAACQLVLLALKATSFCSSFIGLHDLTKTTTATGPSNSALTTIPAASCVVTAAANTITSTTTTTISGPTVASFVTLSAITDTTTVTLPPTTVVRTITDPISSVILTETTLTTSTVVSTITLGPVRHRRDIAEPMGHRLLARVTKSAPSSSTTSVSTKSTSTSTSTKPTSTSTKQATAAGSCTLKGLPPQITPFVCDVVSKACSAIVQPKTVAVTTTVPGGTKVQTITASQMCAVVTAPNVVIYSTMTFTNSATTVINTVTPSRVVVTGTVTPLDVTLTQTITPPPIASTTTATLTLTIVSTVTSSTVATSTDATPCGTTIGNGFFGYIYNNYCNTICQPQSPINYILSDTIVASFQDCINTCDTSAVITLVNYDVGTGQCTCTFTGGNKLVGGQQGKTCAVVQESGVDGG